MKNRKHQIRTILLAASMSVCLIAAGTVFSSGQAYAKSVEDTNSGTYTVTNPADNNTAYDHLNEEETSTTSAAEVIPGQEIPSETESASEELTSEEITETSSEETSSNEETSSEEITETESETTTLVTTSPETEPETSKKKPSKEKTTKAKATTKETTTEEETEEEFDIGEDVYMNIGVVVNDRPEKFGSLYWPLPSEYGPGFITSGYGYRTGTYSGMHSGLDIGAPEGTPVYACEDGVVIASYFSDSAGNFTIIQHDGGLYTEYMHQSVRYVQAGEKVKAGQMIGLVGSTGWSTGSHLHIGVVISDYGYDLSQRVDPTPYLMLINKLDPSANILSQESMMLAHENGIDLTAADDKNKDVISSLGSVFTEDVIENVTYAGFDRRGYIDLGEKDAKEENGISLLAEAGYKTYEDVWIKYETADFDMLISLDATYNNADKAIPLSVRTDKPVIAMNSSVCAKADLTKSYYESIPETEGQNFAAAVHVDIYKHGTTERTDLPETYQGFVDSSKGQAYRCLNETFTKDTMILAENAEADENSKNEGFVSSITESGVIYFKPAGKTSGDPSEDLIPDIYRKSEKIQTEGLDMIFGFDKKDDAEISFFVPERKVTFNAEKGGTVSLKSSFVTYGKSIENGSIAKADKGYRFVGWVTDQDVIFADVKLQKGKAITMSQIENIIVTTDVSFTAKFEKQ